MSLDALEALPVDHLGRLFDGVQATNSPPVRWTVSLPW